MNLSEDRPTSRSDQLSDDNRSQFKKFLAAKRQRNRNLEIPPQHVNHWNRFEPLRHEDSVNDSALSSNADKSLDDAYEINYM